MLNYCLKYIKILHYHPKYKRFYKITYGYVKDSIINADSSNDGLLVGKFYSREFDENKKFLEGGQINPIIYVAKLSDIYKEIDKETFENFKNDFLKEVISDGKDKMGNEYIE